MKTIILSDSHGRNLSCFDVVAQEKPDVLIHLGDYYDDALELMHEFPDILQYAVRGNNDYGTDAPYQMVVSLDGVPLYLTHGHREGVSMINPGRVPSLAKESGCRAAFFGHTHRKMLERIGGVLVCNPGSIGWARDGIASYARMITNSGMIERLELIDQEGQVLAEEK